ncbi:hypothetical protein GLAREA_09421 [Glarea lozoyensis ATCC 20868]|uniref:Uncharacterized protein n=1 Tax=Glarea lozoyensis (strain ATCC 20868 / MF5171) TaxID=1116229 RepID=S3D8I5_GLAL2|nr:uncharacterized protein GLAREA_09421 [Glarea lozoyensis ATCC 20868]EPE28301.1 hypothetical protein GLAREA_09421 [Glarea lozoyensis ATCC 20868]
MSLQQPARQHQGVDENAQRSSKSQKVRFAPHTSEGKPLKSCKVTLHDSLSHYQAEMKRIKETMKKLYRLRVATKISALLSSDYEMVFLNYIENRLERLELQRECYRCNFETVNLQKDLKDVSTRLKLHRHSLKHGGDEWEYRTLKKWSAVPAQGHKWTQQFESDTVALLTIEKADVSAKISILDQRFARLSSKLEQNGTAEKKQPPDVVTAWKRFDVKLGVKRYTDVAV